MDDKLRLLLVWLGLVSLLAFVLFGWDKGMARLGRRRVPEGTLWAAALLGGGTGAALGMYLFRHKIKKGLFPFALPLLAILQLALVGWVTLR